MGKINTLDQDRTFCFFLITRTSIGAYFFEWDEPNHKLQMQMLNTICGWSFVRGWNDREYKHPTGKVIKWICILKMRLNHYEMKFVLATKIVTKAL